MLTKKRKAMVGDLLVVVPDRHHCLTAADAVEVRAVRNVGVGSQRCWNGKASEPEFHR